LYACKFHIGRERVQNIDRDLINLMIIKMCSVSMVYGSMMDMIQNHLKDIVDFFSLRLHIALYFQNDENRYYLSRVAVTARL